VIPGPFCFPTFNNVLLRNADYESASFAAGWLASLLLDLEDAVAAGNQ
jgi:hypothetical protein